MFVPPPWPGCLVLATVLAGVLDLPSLIIIIITNSPNQMKRRSRYSRKGVSGLAREVEEVGTKPEEARSTTTRLSDTGLVPL